MQHKTLHGHPTVHHIVARLVFSVSPQRATRNPVCLYSFGIEEQENQNMHLLTAKTARGRARSTGTKHVHQVKSTITDMQLATAWPAAGPAYLMDGGHQQQCQKASQFRSNAGNNDKRQLALKGEGGAGRTGRPQGVGRWEFFARGVPRCSMIYPYLQHFSFQSTEESLSEWRNEACCLTWVRSWAGRRNGAPGGWMLIFQIGIRLLSACPQSAPR